MARRRRKNDRVLLIEAAIPLIGFLAFATAFVPPFRQAIIAPTMVLLLFLGGVALLVIGFLLIRKMMKNRGSSVWNFGRRRTLPSDRPLRSYNMSTLEAAAVKPNPPPPKPDDDSRFRPKVWVSPNPIITSATSSTNADPIFTRRTPPVMRHGTKALSADELIERLRAIDWFQFEKVVALTFEMHGYHVNRRGGANPDGGIDMVIEKNGERTGIQCKQWKSWKLPEKTVREFVGALHIEEIQKGAFVILKGCTGPARELAEARGIEILGEQELVEMLEAVDAQHHPEVRQLLKDERKFCPKCEAEMVVRTTRKGENAGGQFWGCSTYPCCHFTMPIS